MLRRINEMAAHAKARQDRQTTIELIHNLYKDRYYCRPSHINFTVLSQDDLDAFVEYLSNIPVSP